MTNNTLVYVVSYTVGQNTDSVISTFTNRDDAVTLFDDCVQNRDGDEDCFDVCAFSHWDDDLGPQFLGTIKEWQRED